MIFQYEPIGFIQSDFKKKYSAPRQPRLESENVQSKIILNEGQNFEQALDDLIGFEYIWLIFSFHRNDKWKPKVLPPRTESKKGVFSTRSPHRPNPIGLSLVKLISISGREIIIGDHDLLDETPILDIKPYLPHVESIPEAKFGWIEERNSARKNYEIEWSEKSKEQMLWLLNWFEIDFSDHAEKILKHSPFPHPYNRIAERESGNLIFSYQSWRLLFQVDESKVFIEEVFSGYALETLKLEKNLQQQDAHLAFYKMWP